MSIYNEDAATVIQRAINKIPYRGAGRIFIKKAEEPYDIYSTIEIDARAVIIDSDWATLTLKADGDMFVFIDAFRRDNLSWSELNNVIIDHNQQDGAAITIEDTWYAKIRCSILNVKHMGVWLISRHENIGSYCNEIYVNIQGINTNNGFGIILWDDPSKNGSTNFNHISGTAFNIQYGIKIDENCTENIIENFWANNNNYSYNIWGKRTKLINVYEDHTVTYGVYLRPGSSAVIIPGYLETNIKLEGDAKATVLDETGVYTLPP